MITSPDNCRLLSGLLTATVVSVAAAQAPLPQPGQTVQWTTAMSPIIFSAGDAVIPAGGTVIVAPGVTIATAGTGRLVVNGAISGAGTQALPIVLQGSNGLQVAGEAAFAFTQISGRVGREGVGFLSLTDCTVLPSGDGAGVGGRHSAAAFERCTIQTDYFEPWGHVAFRDCTFTGTFFRTVNYAYIDGLTSSAPVTLHRDGQNMYVDGLNVSGVTGSNGAVEVTGGVDFLLGPGNTLTGNAYPVRLLGAGLHPDSHVPLTGNSNNAIRADAPWTALRHTRITWPNLGMPYHFLDDGTYSGGVRIAPGCVLKFASDARLLLYGTQGNHNIRGLPGQPIRFERLNPAQEWLTLGLAGGVNLLEHLHIEGAGLGISAPQSTNFLRDSTISNCATGTQPSGQGFFDVLGTRYLNNGIGAKADASGAATGTHSGYRLDGAERGNFFAGNTLAADTSPSPGGGVAPLIAPNNWWNHPTGPNSPWFNPAGQGDPVGFAVEVVPFRAAPPDLTDTPPVVRLTSSHYPFALPGEKILLEWEASDDQQIVSQEILLDTRGGGMIEFQPVATNLPGTQRRYELTIPNVGPINDARHCMIRIAATDNAGYTGFEQVEIYIPRAAPMGQVSFITPVAQGFRPGQEVSICYNALGMVSSPQIYLDLSADERWVRGPAGQSGLNKCTFIELRFPILSTDRARLAIRAEANGNAEEWYYSDVFAIRPDSRLGDAPPTVQMTAPSSGQQFQGGGTIPVAWTASDDEGLRAFKLQYSTTSGYHWHTLTDKIPGSARSYNLQLPDSSGISDLRLRIVAIDHRFQNSASGDDRVLSVLPGSGPPPCYANCDGSTIPPVLNVADFTCFLQKFAASDPYANCDGSTVPPVLNVADFTCFLQKFAAGCR